jgi:predicted MFS family arabinose efflux permease
MKPAISVPAPLIARAVGGPHVVYATFLLTVINVFNYIDRMVLAVLVQPIKSDLGLTDTQIGLLTGFAFVAMYAVVSVPLARLADRIGRRWVLAGAVGIWSLMTAASGLTTSFLQLAVARIGVGVGEAGYMPSSHALLADLFPPGRRTLPIAIATAGAAIGIALGLTIGGLVAGAYGWRAAFLIVGLPGVLLAIVVWLTLPEANRTQIDSAPQPPFWASVRTLFGIRTYRWVFCTHPFYVFVTSGVVGWLPAFFMRSHGMSVQHVGALFGVSYGFGLTIGAVVGAYVIQRVTSRTPERGLYFAGWLMLMGFPCYAIALAISSSSISLALIMLFGALSGAAGPPMIAAQQGVAGNRTRATASAISMLFSSYVGGGLGPLLVGMGSEALMPAFGANALRMSLLMASIAIVLPGIFMLRASRTYAADSKD